MILSALSPFYGLLAGNLKDVLWMTGANVAILAAVILAVLLIAGKGLRGSGNLLGRAFVTSLLADLVGVFVRFLPLLTEMLLRLLGFRTAANWLGKFVSNYTWFQIWNNRAVGLSWTIGSILAAGVFVFFFHDKVLLKQAVPEKKFRLILSIGLAVFSAPYSWTNPMW